MEKIKKIFCYRKEAKNLTDGMDYVVYPLGYLSHYSEIPFFLKLKNRIKKKLSYWDIKFGLFDIKLKLIGLTKKWKK